MSLTEDHTTAEAFAEARDALAERLVDAATGTLELFSVHLGRELGLYEAVAEAPLTARGLAERARIAERYAREWLEQQTVAGLLEVTTDSSGGTAEDREYAMPAAHRPVLLDATGASHVAPVADMVAGIGGVLGELPAAYRSGGGIPYARYGRAFSRGQGGMNRPLFVNDLDAWLDALLDVRQRLGTGAGARIADIGAGDGWSTIALARAFPEATVDGYDADEVSAEAARRHAAESGVADRVTFHDVDVAAPGVLCGPYDLVVVFEVLHDLARPQVVLEQLSDALADGGVLLVADERVSPQFTTPGSAVERLMYGWSVTHCLPASLAEPGSAGLGTVLRPGHVHALAAAAGMRSEELPVENDFFRFYRLKPVSRASLPTGVEIAYVDSGSPAEQTLILLHGLSDSSWSWSRLVPHLPDGVRTVAVDLRGHGASSKPADGYSMAELAADVVALMDHLGIGTATVIGHSWGTLAARAVAEEHPDRVEQLVLIGGVQAPVNEAMHELDAEVRALGDTVPESFVRDFQESTLGTPLPEAFMEKVVAESRRLPAAVWRAAMQDFVAADDAETIRGIAAPTLLVWGDRDSYFLRPEQERLLAAIPDSRLVVVPDAGHATHWERPSEVAAEIAAFVRATPARV
jgi:pimeloyl-ACP methyl ester carboxylesterase/ubiquinone/menaquinone biosynthesis C-methylase UbiE